MATGNDAELARLTLRVRQLEEELVRVRASRRVLLDILAAKEAQQQRYMTEMQREMQRLRQRRRPLSH